MTVNRHRTALALTFVVTAAVVTMRAAPTANWPGFRGPTADGVADAPGVPLTWSKTENIKWAVDVPGRGWSSPVIWNGVVYLHNIRDELDLCIRKIPTGAVGLPENTASINE
jgi:hypothetical protein